MTVEEDQQVGGEGWRVRSEVATEREREVSERVRGCVSRKGTKKLTSMASSPSQSMKKKKVKAERTRQDRPQGRQRKSCLGCVREKNEGRWWWSSPRWRKEQGLVFGEVDPLNLGGWGRILVRTYHVAL